MKFFSKTLLVPAGIAITLLTLTGCASSQKAEVTEEKQYSGYLSNYDDLKKVKSNDREFLRWISPEANKRGYKKVLPMPMSAIR